MTQGVGLARFAPWTGLFGGAAAWFADHQIASDSNVWDCHKAGGAFAITVGLVCLAATLAGGIASWRSAPTDRDQEPDSRRFARIVGVGSAAVFALAIAFGTWAGVLVPGCQR